MDFTRALIWIGSLVYVVAWFVPVIKGGTTLAEGGFPGGEAFVVSLMAPWNKGAGPRDALLPFLSALTNLLVPLTWYWVSRGLGTLPRYLPRLLVGAVVVNASWMVMGGTERADLRPGYYLWFLGFVLLTVAAFRARATSEADSAPAAGSRSGAPAPHTDSPDRSS